MQSLIIEPKWVGAPFAALLRRHQVEYPESNDCILRIVFVLLSTSSDVIQVKYSSIALQVKSSIIQLTIRIFKWLLCLFLPLHLLVYLLSFGEIIFEMAEGCLFYTANWLESWWGNDDESCPFLENISQWPKRQESAVLFWSFWNPPNKGLILFYIRISLHFLYIFFLDHITSV